MHPPFKTQLLEARKIHHFQTKKNSSSLTSRRLGFRFPAVHVFRKKKAQNPMFSGVLLGQRMATQGGERFFLRGEFFRIILFRAGLQVVWRFDNNLPTSTANEPTIDSLTEFCLHDLWLVKVMLLKDTSTEAGIQWSTGYRFCILFANDDYHMPTHYLQDKPVFFFLLWASFIPFSKIGRAHV